MTKKRKDLNINSPEWTVAWERVLKENFIMRCLVEQERHVIIFRMEVFLEIEHIVYRIRLTRFSGGTIELPKVFVIRCTEPLEKLLEELEYFWTGNGFIPIRELMLAVPHRGFVIPFGSTNIILLPTNHQILMANYGAVREWMRYEGKKQTVLQTFEQRFEGFLYQQELATIKDTVGEIVLPQFD